MQNMPFEENAIFKNTVFNLIEEYGLKSMQQMMKEFLQKVQCVSDAHAAFAALTEKKLIDDQYNIAVNQIMYKTSEYYAYLRTLDENIRNFFVSLGSLGVDNEFTIIDLANMLGDDTLSQNPVLSLQSIRPRKYIMQIDAITNQLTSLNAENSIFVGKRGSQPVYTSVTLDMPDHMRIEGGGSLSTYDRSIINGVTSLIESGNSVFSIPMLYHAMTGKQNPTVDEQLVEEISAKLDKMRRMLITIDLTEENIAKYIKDTNGEVLKIEDLTLEGYLMPLNKIAGVVNGKRTEIYQLIQYPPLYSYSKMKRQLAAAPIELLSAPVNNNATTIPLKTYLIQRIETMKNHNNNIVSNSILYESIYRELGAEGADKTRKMRIRSYVEVILDHFIQKEYIQGYSQFKSGRSIYKIDVLF